MSAVVRREPAPGVDSTLRVTPVPLPEHVRPTVSVVIPSYNYAEYLPSALASVLTQTGVDVSVVVVDDASTDGSRALALAIAASDDRVRVVAHEENAGPVATFNDGLPFATGDYLVRLDADDLLTPGALSRAVALLERFPGVGFAYGHPLHFQGPVPIAMSSPPRSWTIWHGRDWLWTRCKSGLNCITSPEVVMRRRVVDEVGGQRALAHGHDMEMWFRLAAVSDVGRVNGPDQALHRDHPRSLSACQVDTLSDLRERLLVFETLFSQSLLPPVQTERLLASARRTLAVEALGLACHEYDRGRGANPLVEAYVEFARQTYQPIAELPYWRGISVRRALGPRITPLVPYFFLHAVQRRIRADLARRRWHRTGL